MNRNHYIKLKLVNMAYLKTFLLIAFGVIILSYNADGQSKEFNRTYFPGGGKELREARKNFEEGNELYEKGWGYYDDALTYYLKAYEFNPDNALMNMRIGECYLTTIYKDKAIPYLEKAVELNVETLEIFFILGVAYQLNYRFDDAVEQFEFFSESLTPQEALQERERIDKRIDECKNAKELLQSPVRVFVDNAGEKINSEYDDYGPVFTPDGTMVFFTTRRPLGKRPKKDDFDQKYFENIMYSAKKGDGWTQSLPVEGKINKKKGHDATAGIAHTGERLYIYRGDKGGDMFVSHAKDENRWSKPRRLSSPLSLKRSQETNIAFTSDGKQVFFISEREGGYGERDIWTALADKNGRWEEPFNLGATINTQYDEFGLYLSPDNNTLYFSSEGHNSMGGFDIFKTQYKNGRWTKPENIGHPINTPADDMYFVLYPEENIAYYAARKLDSFGGSDIYKITFLGPEKEQEQPVMNTLVAHQYQPLDFDLMESEVEINTVPMTILRGTIKDQKSEEPVAAHIELYDNQTEELLAEFTNSPETGEYLISMPGGKNYGISVNAEEYLFHSENINIADGNVAREIINDITLKKVEVGESIVLNNIFFETGSTALSPESYVELGILLKLLQDNPSIKIEVSGHTDNVGSEAVNKRISQQRAKAVVDFLIGRGISKNRLTFKGYGFDRPIASNETEDGRQLNRRTEFEVIEK